MEFQRGDTVWARAVYPKIWYPGLVSKTDNLGIEVHFFRVIEPRYFLESEVRPFKENFESLVKTIKCSNGEALLDLVLKVIGRRVVSSIQCPCQYPSLESENVKRNNKYDVDSVFCANSVVSFVRRLGVRPYVEDSDFVRAVTLGSQIQFLRRFLGNQQKKLLNEEANKKGLNLDNAVSLPASGNGTHSVAQISVISELELITSLDNQSNSGLLIQTKKTKQQPPKKMLVNLHSLTLAGSCMRKECFSTGNQCFLMFGNSSYKSRSRPEFIKCSYTSSEFQFSYPSRMRSQPGSEVDGKAGRANSGPLIPHVAGHSNFVGLKRRNDRPADSIISFKLRKILPPFSISKAAACLQKRKMEHRVPICDISIPGLPLSDFSLDSCNSKSYFSPIGEDARLRRSKTGFEVAKEIQNCHSMHLIQNMLNFHLTKDASHSSNTLELSIFQENIDNADALNDNATCLPIGKMQELGEDTSILTNDETLKPVNYDVVEKMTDGMSKNKMDACKPVLQFSTIRPLINCFIETYSNNDKKIGNARAAARNFQLSNMATCQLPENPSNGHDAPSGASMISYSKSLYMKFPNSLNLPSKMDLIMKFSRFGRVDPLETKVFPRMGSAQVVFLDELDTVVAYQFAKRKNILFGEAMVLYWLDPFEHERRGSKFLSAPSSSNLKSCLKKSARHGKEDKNCIRKVRFRMET